MKRKEYNFGDLDSEDEIIAAFEDLENRVANELEAIEVELSHCVKQKKNKKKGFVMNRVLVSIAVLAIIGGLIFTVARAAYVRDDINYDIASNPDLLSQYLRDVLAESTYWRFTPQASAPSGSDLAEGVLYYNDTTNKLMVSTDGSTFTALESAAGNSLDSAYDAGSGITVDGSAVTLTTGAAVNNAALAIVHGETTNDNDAFTIANSADAATAVSIQIDGTAGYDIQGTGDTWNVSIAGAASLVGITNTAGDVLFDDTYDVFWDTSKDLLLFNDNAELGFGGASGDDPDVGIIWNASNLLIESAAEDTGEIQIGSTNAIDLVLYANTNTSEVAFNANTATAEFNGYDIQIMDDDKLAFGDSDEFVIEYNEDNNDELLFTCANANDQVIFGDTTTNLDVVWQSTTSGDTVTFDSSGLDVDVVDIDIDLDDDANLRFGTSDDITIGFDGSGGDLDITGTGLEVSFGVDDEGMTVIFHGETTGENLTWDESADSLTVTGDLALFTLTGTTLPFHANVTGTVAGEAAKLETTDGGITLLADGAANGDILIDAADKITIVSTDADADGIYIHANGGASESIEVHSDQGTGDESILLSSDVGGITLNAAAGSIDIEAVGGAAGDIILNAGDDMTFTVAGNLVETITGTGAVTTAGYTITSTALITTNGAFYETSRVTENHSASHTLTDPTDIGTLITVDTAAVVITLPAVSANATYTVMNIGADGTEIHVNPDNGDKIVGGCGFAAALDDGDQLTNTGATADYGDMVTLTYFDATGWLITKMVGTWADGG